MTGPEEPGDDWAFPEIASPEAVSPSSVELPQDDEQVYDTGSDAWWRAQADAQRRAAQTETAPTPVEQVAAEPLEVPPTVEPTVLLPEPPAPAPPLSPLDTEWVPPELPELRPPVATSAPAVPEVAVPDWYQPSEPAAAAAAEVGPRVLQPTEAYELPTLDEPVEPAYVEPAFVEPVEPAYVEPPAAAPGPVRVRPATADLPPPLVAPATRPAHEGERVGPVRAVAGALLAVAGVALLIAAPLVLSGGNEPKGTPTVQAPPTPVATHAPSTTPGATPSRAASSAPSPTSVAVVPTASATPSPAAAPVLPVEVLNNSKIKGLADTAAKRFMAGGWPVSGKGNYRGGVIATTTIYFAAGQEASARRFAAQFGIPRVAPRFTGLPGSGLTVVLTRDYR